MKVVFFNYLGIESIGGTQKFFIEIPLGLKKRYPQLNVTVITLHDRIITFIKLIYRMYYLGRFQLVTSDRKFLKTFRSSRISYIKANSIKETEHTIKKQDVLYVQNDILGLFFLKHVLRVQHVPKIVVGFHTPLKIPHPNSFQSVMHNILYSSFLYRQLIPRKALIHVLNISDFEYAKSCFPKHTITLIYNPFDFTSFADRGKIFFNSHYCHSNKTVRKFLWVGRLTEQKGVKDLIDIISKINTEYASKVVWHIAGSGELQKDIVQLKKEWSNVHFLGPIPNNLLPAIYRDNDAFLCTSKWENFPYTLLEAQAVGLPVISYSIDGCQDIVQNKINGILVKDIHEFALALRDCIEYIPFQKSKIKSYIRRKFNSKVQYQKLYRLFI